MLFSPLLGGFRQGYNTQHILLNILKSCKNSIDNKRLAGAVVMDLSKAFGCLSHYLLLAKLSTYRLKSDALQLISNYLTIRKQRVKSNSLYSTWEQIEVQQGLVLGPLLLLYIYKRHFLICKSHKNFQQC